MAARVAFAVLVVTAIVFAAQACEPETLGDYFIPPGVDRNNIGSDYFTSTLLRGEPVIAAGAKFSAKRLGSNEFPVLTNLAVSSALLKYLPEGINPFHIHPRGTELLIVLKGTLNVGLIDTANKLFTAVLQEGDVFVFPKGLVHYQINLSRLPVIAYAAFSSSNPGTVSLPVTLFGTGIPKVVHETAFKVHKLVIDKLEAPFRN
ncbi:germin-like protein 9-3 [Physcomitrium patens]|uniref:Germin-like protein n=1 Tax=Physcomitrium patens TaxID=3218 RepID=A9S0B0_PHYPA|nr:germin-like protein 9-3 [Physcomitrium patens]XP_024388265.1 germin-like protein 9-3 [Physcomitrium patens]PNR44666.1 hypothetical protein PHYPA_014435 [Physcomitrium patens]|eukprot:XP_024388264.1 germin-like protein 9-3 [Physcomitrella patens]